MHALYQVSYNSSGYNYLMGKVTTRITVVHVYVFFVLGLTIHTKKILQM